MKMLVYGRLKMRDRLGQRERGAFPLVRNLGRVAGGLEDENVASQDLDHFGMTYVKGSSAGHVDPEGKEWFPLHELQKRLRCDHGCSTIGYPCFIPGGVGR